MNCLEKRYAPITVGVPVYSGKMDNIVKNRKDYCMDTICHNPHSCWILGGLEHEERRGERRGWQKMLACSDKVLVCFFII